MEWNGMPIHPLLSLPRTDVIAKPSTMDLFTKTAEHGRMQLRRRGASAVARDSYAILRAAVLLS